MNTIIHNTIRNTGIALATLLLVAVWFAVAPKAQATELGGWDDIGYYDMSSPSYDGGGWDDVGYYDMSSPSYDTGFYDMGGFSGGGYSFGGGGFTGGSTLGGGGFRGGSSLGGGYSYSTVYAPTNTNTCTAVNSCNSYWDDHSIFNAPTTIVTNYPPAQTYSQPTYQPVQHYCPSGYSGTYPNCIAPVVYRPAPQPLAYSKVTPYVTLAAVPYTGLELGPLGTAAYWGFLVLWCLFAAYLIVVKKVHNKIAAWFTGGTEPKTLEKKSGLPASAVLAETGDPRTFEREFPAKSAAPLLAGIDPFVLAQISRAK